VFWLGATGRESEERTDASDHQKHFQSVEDGSEEGVEIAGVQKVFE